MKLVTYARGIERRIGALSNGFVIDLQRASTSLLMERGRPRPRLEASLLVPAEMISFLDGGEESLAAARQAVAHIEAQRNDAAALRARDLLFDQGEVRLCAPVPRPRKLVLMGLNYRAHAEEAGGKEPPKPILFQKSSNVVIGPGDPIHVPRMSSQVDYEAELAVVIGKEGRDIPRQKARDYVVGYTLMNDVSARDVQRERGQWLLGKSFDTFGPMGPWIVTKDEAPDPQNLDIQCVLNGEVMQHSNTGMMIFPIDDIIAHISQVFTLEPGDVISTGTPEGVGFARKPPVFMKAGDTVRVIVEKIGALENPVIDAP